MNFIQRTLHQSLCSDSMIFLHKFFLKRTTVYTNTNGYSSLLCHINHCFDSLCTADISGIDPDLICTVFHGCNSKTRIKMDICHKWYMDLFFDFLQCFCSFHSRYCTTDNITAGSLKGKDLNQAVEEFTSEMTLVAEGLSEDQNALRRDGEKLAARMEKLAERQKIGEDSVKALQDQLEQERRRGDALQKRLDDMEKALKAKPVKPGLTAILRQATWGVGIICAAWVIVAILKLIGG